MPHTLLIAVIFTAYFGCMAALFGYLATQARHREEEPEQLPDITPRDDEPDGMLAAA